MRDKEMRQADEGQEEGGEDGRWTEKP